MAEISSLQIGFLLLAAATLIPLMLWKLPPRIISLVTGLLSGCGAVYASFSAFQVLISQNTFSLTLPVPGTVFGPLSLTLDPLSAVFLCLLSIVAVPLSLYSIGYLNSTTHGKQVHFFCSLYPLFLLSLYGVFLSSNAVLFLMAWETMTLLSFFFILGNTHAHNSDRAAYLYLMMTHVGAICLIMLFLFLFHQTQSFSFASYVHLGSSLGLSLKLALFLLTLIGFGTKAGLVPLHIWLPEAHPAAPSHVSALMSGVMIKTALYGMLRVLFTFLSPLPYTWGFILATVALLTALLGILYGFREKDLKRLLAFSSIENIGIILLPVGIAIVYNGLNQPTLAAVALTTTLFYALNHATFKSLLFMAAGAILAETHTVNLERLGGLIKRMPKTAILFLVGALAAASLPPFGGFISKWMIFQTLLEDFHLHSIASKIFTPFAASLLGLVGALTLATFVKAFGAVFLAFPRSPAPEKASEVSTSMLGGMAMLAAVSLLLGPFSPFVLSALSTVSVVILNPTVSPVVASRNGLFIQAGSQAFASTSPLLLTILLLGFIPLCMGLVRMLGGKTETRQDITWSCGVSPSPEFEHTPAGLAQPLVQVFAKPLGTQEQFYTRLYLPIVQQVLRFSKQLRPLQAGRLQLYLAYMFATLMACLGWLTFAG